MAASAQHEVEASSSSTKIKVKRGAFLLFEGIDRCGKTTQSNLLVDHLRAKGEKVELVVFPDRTSETGKLLDKFLKKEIHLPDETVHLLFSANRWEAAERMERSLEEGTTLIVDRYAFSGVAFTGAKHIRSLSWCKCPDSGLPAPDAVFYLDLSVDEAMIRGGYGDEIYERCEFQNEVLDIYPTLSDNTWFVVDAARTRDVILKELVVRASTIMDSIWVGAPIQTLWPDEIPTT